MDDMGRAGSDELDRVLPGTAHRGLQGRVLSSSKRKRARMLLEGVQICRSQELSMELRTSVVGYPFLDRRTVGHFSHYGNGEGVGTCVEVHPWLGC